MKIVSLSNFSFEFLSRFINKSLQGEIIDLEYDQYVQMICFKDSQLYQNEHDAALLFLDYSKLLISMNEEEIKALLTELVECYSENSKGKILIINNVFLKRDVTFTIDTVIASKNKIIQEDLNLFLAQLSKQNKCLSIFDMLSVYEEYGFYNLTDHNVGLFSDSSFSKLGLEIISAEIIDYINAIFSSRKKCLVLDFDNTLWGGVAGEDGLNVKVGGDRIGIMFMQFQKEIKKLKEKGVLLVSCSKNNEEDAKKIFDDKPNMILKWEDFIIHKVNWERKDLNIIEIASELNIGTDSMVFIDDSASERLLVSEGTNAHVPEFPRDLDLVRMVSEIDRKCFSTLTVTHEDSSKHQQYLDNISRTNSSSKYKNINDFINSLEIKLFIKLNDMSDLDRAFQLSHKTNQFNFTTNRYSKNEMKDMILNDDVDVLTCRVEDRFGDYGTTVLLIVFKDDLTWKIDTFLMSCRVLGKQVENAVLNWYLVNRYNGDILMACYKPTKKNKQLENKYEELGFIETEKSSLSVNYKLDNIKKFDLLVEVNYE
jgi:FkbH-like protein